MIDPNAIAARLERELFDSIVPFWENHSPDPVNGGFFNLIDRDGTVFDTEKFVWMQWRNIYMFALLANTPAAPPRWLELAESGFRFCRAHAQLEDGGFAFSVTAEGKISDYDPLVAPMIEAIAAIASAQLFRATGQDVYRTEALLRLKRVREMIRAREAAGPLPGIPAFRSLGAWMHLVNAAAEVFACAGKMDGSPRRFLEEALEVLPGFRHPESGRWIERIGLDGSFRFGNSAGRMLMPGHGFETLWFMAEAAELIGNRELLAKIPDWTRSVYENALDREQGGLFPMQDALDLPLVLKESVGLKWWWTHSEALLALAMSWKISRDEWFLARFEEIDAWCTAHFRDSRNPEWFGWVDRAGNPVSLVKGTPSKTCFHVPRCLYCCAKFLRGE